LRHFLLGPGEPIGAFERDALELAAPPRLPLTPPDSNAEWAVFHSYSSLAREKKGRASRATSSSQVGIRPRRAEGRGRHLTAGLRANSPAAYVVPGRRDDLSGGRLVAAPVVSSAPTIFFAGRVAAGAVGEIGDSLLLVLLLDLSRVMFVAAVAGVLTVSGWMASAALTAGVTVVHREGVRAVPRRRQPGAGGVTRCAILSEHALMDLRLRVASRAGRRHAAERASRVAIRAPDRAVRAGEWKARAIVIEGHVRPSSCAVACTAIPSELSIVLVVGGVTVHTTRRGTDIATSGMARVARNIEMRADERERRAVVIKGHL